MLGLGQSICIPTKFLDVMLQAQLGIRDRLGKQKLCTRERMALRENIMLKEREGRKLVFLHIIARSGTHL